MKTKIKKNEKEKFSLKKELNENFKIKNEKIKPKLHKENFFDDNCFQTKNNPINSKIEFITTDIDKYLKCDNRSQSITIHNLANSFDANNNSRLIDSMINTKASNLNQNSSYSKVNNTIKKRLIFGQINDEEKNNSVDYVFDLGTRNKLTSVNYTGGETGGGNSTISYSYQTFNDFKVSGVA